MMSEEKTSEDKMKNNVARKSRTTTVGTIASNLAYLGIAVFLLGFGDCEEGDDPEDTRPTAITITAKAGGSVVWEGRVCEPGDSDSGSSCSQGYNGSKKLVLRAVADSNPTGLSGWKIERSYIPESGSKLKKARAVKNGWTEIESCTTAYCELKLEGQYAYRATATFGGYCMGDALNEGTARDSSMGPWVATVNAMAKIHEAFAADEPNEHAFYNYVFDQTWGGHHLPTVEARELKDKLNAASLKTYDDHGNDCMTSTLSDYLPETKVFTNVSDQSTRAFWYLDPDTGKNVRVPKAPSTDEAAGFYKGLGQNWETAKIYLSADLFASGTDPQLAEATTLHELGHHIDNVFFPGDEVHIGTGARMENWFYSPDDLQPWDSRLHEGKEHIEADVTFEKKISGGSLEPAEKENNINAHARLSNDPLRVTIPSGQGHRIYVHRGHVLTFGPWTFKYEDNRCLSPGGTGCRTTVADRNILVARQKTWPYVNEGWIVKDHRGFVTHECNDSVGCMLLRGGTRTPRLEPKIRGYTPYDAQIHSKKLRSFHSPEVSLVNALTELTTWMLEFPDERREVFGPDTAQWNEFESHVSTVRNVPFKDHYVTQPGNSYSWIGGYLPAVKLFGDSTINAVTEEGVAMASVSDDVSVHGAYDRSTETIYMPRSSYRLTFEDGSFGQFHEAQLDRQITCQMVHELAHHLHHTLYPTSEAKGGIGHLAMIATCDEDRWTQILADDGEDGLLQTMQMHDDTANVTLQLFTSDPSPDFSYLGRQSVTLDVELGFWKKAAIGTGVVVGVGVVVVFVPEIAPFLASLGEAGVVGETSVIAAGAAEAAESGEAVAGLVFEAAEGGELGVETVETAEEAADFVEDVEEVVEKGDFVCF